jgi:esterase/lipase superfamily enzyme
MSAIKIYFASNRDVKHETSSRARNFGTRFNADGPQCFRVGWVEVDLSGDDPKIDDDWQAGRCELYPEKLGGKDEKIGSDGLFKDLGALLDDSECDVLIYLHGFANDFANTAVRAAALQRIYGEKTAADGSDLLVVMFSWPSNGVVHEPWAYKSDREDAEASGTAMARALAKFVEFLDEIREADRRLLLKYARSGEVPPPKELRQCERKVHLLAHSMGNWALRHLVQKFINLARRDRLPRILDHVFLMGADDDADTLERSEKLGRLHELANQIHVYHSANDRALQISDITKGLPDRLGSDGPANFAVLNEQIFAVDCRNVDDTELTHGNHQYYRLRDEVIEDVTATLRGVAPDHPARARVPLRQARSWRLSEAKQNEPEAGEEAGEEVMGSG